MATRAQIDNIICRTAPIVQKYAKQFGYKICSPAIAQILQESLGKYDGLSLLAYKYHNLHGLKSGEAWLKAGKPSVNMKTGEEYTPGKISIINDWFRVFPNEDAGIKGYYEFLEYKRYAAVRSAATPLAYLQALKAANYCTSTTYVNNCMAKINKYNLTQYDGAAPPVVPILFEIGKTYTLQSNMYVRNEPKGRNLTFEELTEDGRAHAIQDDNGAVLRKGTRVTVKAIQKLDSGAIWLRIPSGWICGKGSSGALYAI